MNETIVDSPELAPIHHDLVVIGGGAAGMAAACAAYDAGVRDIVILEREGATGGILKQCIHNGFGLHRFDEELTGPEYALREAARVAERGIKVQLDTTVLGFDENRLITAVSPSEGLQIIDAGAIVLAMGSRERTRGALGIAGSRPAGIYTAGTAQQFTNLRGKLPGREVVMLGSGDIGLIMARRLTYEGAHVKMVLNRSHFSGGLKRNIVQCLDDYGIPLRLSHTITAVHGRARLEGVDVAQVDPKTKKPIPGTEEFVPCDTLLLSVGLLPENELTRAAGI
ncbi:MAG: FAD-dependent oxidoreductase, partial [Coriobacteriales bacterium]|nr:FAD-dependent oxidoreductase [Coriobacteriales bacterium]